jgi:hypothetical protein
MTIRNASILKAKAGEFQGIKFLGASQRQQIAPMFDFDLPDENKATSAAEQMKKSVQKLALSNPPPLFFVDAFQWAPDAQVETGDHVISYMISTLRAEGLQPIPTIGYDRWGSPEYRLAISHLGAGPSGRYAIRLDRTVGDDIFDPDHVVDVLNDMLATVNAAPSRCTIFIDLEDVSGNHVSVASLIEDCARIIDAISYIPFAAFVVAGSSVPSQINDAVPTRDSTSSIARKENLVWRAIRAQYPELPVIPGDYGVRGPTSYSGPNPNMNGKIRHTSDRIFFVARGHAISEDGSYEQMQSLADAVMRSVHYRGPNYSWADQRIADAASHQFTGNMSSWIAIDTNHHLHFVVEEVREFELTLGRVAEPII